MRTQKRFTPELLARFNRQGRGKGTFEDYLPWHRVGRGDPSSLGRSHLMMWRNRQRELLSDGEWVGFLFSAMLPDLEDVREQHPLATQSSEHELTLYNVGNSATEYPGTLELARQLGIKHPKITESGNSVDWQMTTDQVLVLNLAGTRELLAVAYKPNEKNLSKRQRQLLLLEKTYWDKRKVTWLLITPSLFDESVGLKLRETAPWALGIPSTQAEIETAARVVQQTIGHTYAYTLQAIAAELGGLAVAQRALWQGVWSAKIPSDLRTGWRPHLPIELLTAEDFRGLNPVASRRSAWL